MQTLKALRERIQALETEKTALMVEVERLRKTAEARVVSLEAEVGQIREEAKSLKELLAEKQAQVAVPLPSAKPSSP
jgi:hypothetical protein